MSENKNTDKNNIFIENITTLMSPEGVQKYILGTKKNGTPRAVYDVVKDYTSTKKKNKKGKKKKKHSDELPTSYSFYLSSSSGKKKKNKKKKKKDKHWHI